METNSTRDLVWGFIFGFASNIFIEMVVLAIVMFLAISNSIGRGTNTPYLLASIFVVPFIVTVVTVFFFKSSSMKLGYFLGFLASVAFAIAWRLTQY